MKRIIALLIVLVIVFSGQPAYAHVLVTDTSRTKGAILHIIPDDDPIAGQPSTFYFDIQNIAPDENTTAKLVVTSGSGEQNEITGKLDGSLAIFKYTFPTQGVYELSFRITSGQQVSVFAQSWRVSRGVSISALDTPRHTWAEISLLASGIGFALLAVIMLGRWRYVWKQSTF